MAASPESVNTSPAPNGGGASGRGIRLESLYKFKTRLQQYAKKVGLKLEYQTVQGGRCRQEIFRSTVLIGDARYESLPGFFNRKAAEQSAAEAALMEIGKSVALPNHSDFLQETGLCKDLLQDYAVKMNYSIPSYICNKHTPFICTVEIGGIQYTGATPTCTSKEAKIKAARTALLAIQGQSEGYANGTTKYIAVPGKRQGNETKKKPIETPKILEAKRCAFKKQRNKQKFICTQETAVADTGQNWRVGTPSKKRATGLNSTQQNKGSTKEISNPGWATAHPNHPLRTPLETGLYKDLLHQYAHKMNYSIPSYICNKHPPFVCTVEVGGIHYTGNTTTRTKKEAERIAARIALLAIQGQSEGCANGTTKYIDVPGKRKEKETNKKPIETPKSLEAKKFGFKKQQNNQKYIMKNGRPVNVENDDAVAGDTHQSDVMELAEITQDPSIDTIVLQPDEGAGRVEHEPASDSAILQPDGEARKVEQESPSDTAMLQAHEEAGRVEQEPHSDTPMVLHNDEARSVKQEPFNDTAIPQPYVEDTSVETEPPRDAAVVHPNEDPRSVQEETHIDTVVPQPNEVAKTSVTHASLSDSTIEQPNSEARSIKEEPLSNLQPDGEARKVTQESLSDTAMLQAHEEAGRVEHEPPSDTPMFLHNEEARSVKQEQFDDMAMPQPHVEDRSVEQEPPRYAAVVQPNEEPGSVKEPHIDTAMPQHNAVQPNAEARCLKEESLSNTAIRQHDKETRTVNQELPINGWLLQPKVENSESVSEHNGRIMGDMALLPFDLQLVISAPCLY